MFGDVVMAHGIEVCFKCKCLGAPERDPQGQFVRGADGKVIIRELGHSRDHAHCKERKICLSAVPRGFPSFFTAMHEIGHIVHPQGNYGVAKTRAVAEHNATEWAKQECRRLGVRIRRKTIKQYDSYIKEKVERGLRRGLRVVPSEVRKYLKK